MEKFNKNTLKAAVKNYGTLLSDGKTETEIKEALAADEKAFSPEQIDEIYSAIVTQEEESTKKEYVVLKEFHDRDNFEQVYSPGEIITLPQDRIDHLVSIGYVEEA